MDQNCKCSNCKSETTPVTWGRGNSSDQSKKLVWPSIEDHSDSNSHNKTIKTTWGR